MANKESCRTCGESFEAIKPTDYARHLTGECAKPARKLQTLSAHAMRGASAEEIASKSDLGEIVTATDAHELFVFDQSAATEAKLDPHWSALLEEKRFVISDGVQNYFPEGGEDQLLSLPAARAYKAKLEEDDPKIRVWIEDRLEGLTTDYDAIRERLGELERKSRTWYLPNGAAVELDDEESVTLRRKAAADLLKECAVAFANVPVLLEVPTQENIAKLSYKAGELVAKIARLFKGALPCDTRDSSVESSKESTNSKATEPMTSGDSPDSSNIPAL